MNREAALVAFVAMLNKMEPAQAAVLKAAALRAGVDLSKVPGYVP